MDMEVRRDFVAGGADLIGMRGREHRREPGFRRLVLEPVEPHVGAGFEDFGVDRVSEIFDVEDALVVDGHERLSVCKIETSGRGGAIHSALMPAALMIGPHLS